MGNKRASQESANVNANVSGMGWSNATKREKRQKQLKKQGNLLLVRHQMQGFAVRVGG